MNKLAIPSEYRQQDRFIITLDVHNGKDDRLRAVELNNLKVHNRYSFYDNQKMSDVFVPPLVKQLRSTLRDIVDDRRVVSLPDFIFELPGVVLQGLRVIASEMVDGVRRVMVRFAKVRGHLTSVFLGQSERSNSILAAREKVAVQALADIVMPLGDILQFADGIESEEQVDDIKRSLTRLSELTERHSEVSLHLDMLVRYVEQCAAELRKGEQFCGLDFAALPRAD